MQFSEALRSPPEPAAPARPDRRAGAWLYALFFLSGAAALIYQVVWTRRLFLTLGATSLAVATILTAFMTGLALGSLTAGRLVDRRRDYLRIYAFLELGIGAYGALTPWLFDAAEGVFRAVLGLTDLSLWPSYLLRFALAMAILIVPTALMGATLPVLARQIVETLGHVGRRLGLLYAVNTFGAAFGVLLTGFVLITTWGITGTILFAAGLNLLVAALAGKLDLTLRRAAGVPTPGAGPTPEAPAAAAPAPASPSTVDRHPSTLFLHRWVLLIAALGGFASFLYEIAWTRVLTLVLGSAVQAFSVMLATFLVGLALGSFVLSRWIDRSRDLFLFYAVVEGGVAIAAIAILPFFGELPWIYIRFFSSVGDSHPLLSAFQFILSGSMLIVPTFLIGVTFPVVGALYVRDLGSLGRRIGEVYFANTAGGIAGSFAGGFVCIPLLGMERTCLLASAVNAACALAAAVLGKSPARQRLAAAWTIAGAVLVLLAVYPLAWERPFQELPRVSDAPDPPAGWAAARGACPACGAPVWLPEPPGSDGRPARLGAACTACAPAEHRRWAAERRLAPRWAWDPRVLAGGAYVHADDYAKSPDGAVFRRFLAERELLFYREGLDAVVTVVTVRTAPASRSLQVNGKTDASNLGDFPTEILLGALPMLIHPDPREVLVIGLGSGITTGSVARFAEARRIDVVEIEAAVVEGARLFTADNHDVLPDPACGRAGDPRLELTVQDARHLCAVTPRRYDVVLNQPSNPWMSGPSHLFTLDHFRNLRRVAKDDGLVAQWFQTYGMTPELVLSVIRTFREVFGHVLVIAYPGQPGNLFLLGAARPVRLDAGRIRARLARPAVRDDLGRVNYQHLGRLLAVLSLDGEDLDRAVGLGPPGRSPGGRVRPAIPLNTDDFPVVEFEAPRHRHRDSSREVLAAVFRDRERPRPPIEPEEPELLRDLRLLPTLARLHETLDLTEGAIRLAEQGLALDPEDDGLRADLAALYVRTWKAAPKGDAAARKERARELLTALTVRQPLYAAAHEQLGDLAFDEGAYDLAIRHYESALAAGRRTPQTLSRLGEACARRGRFEEAAQLFDEAIAADPAYFRAHAGLVEVCERTGRPDQARESLMRWLAHETRPPKRLSILRRLEGWRERPNADAPQETPRSAR